MRRILCTLLKDYFNTSSFTLIKCTVTVGVLEVRIFRTVCSVYVVVMAQKCLLRVRKNLVWAKNTYFGIKVMILGHVKKQ